MIYSSAWTMARQPAAALRIYSALPRIRHCSNLNAPTPTPSSNFKNSDRMHIYMAPNRSTRTTLCDRGLQHTVHIQKRFTLVKASGKTTTPAIPQQSSSLSTSTVGSRSARARRGLSTMQHSDHRIYYYSQHPPLASPRVFSRPTACQQHQQQRYHEQCQQPLHCATNLRYPMLVVTPNASSMPLVSSTLSHRHASGSSPRASAPRSRTAVQNRVFSSSPASAYAQPYFAVRNSQGNTLRIHLSKSRDFVGIRSSRCQRKYNQDRYKVLVLNPPTLSPELASSSASPSPSGESTKRNGNVNNTNNNTQTYVRSTEGTQMDADQKTLFYFAIFDGHGGSHTADYLTAHLDEYIEQAKPDMVPKVIRDLRKLGGYFRSFRPHFLEPFLPGNFEEKYGRSGSKHAVAERERQQKRVHIKGKGGQVKPMIFIPHPNASEEDQKEELKNLESEAEAASGTKMADSQDSRANATAPAISSSAAPTPTAAAKEEQKEQESTKLKQDDDEEDEYDEDEDPLVIARRRHLNRTSPLPGGTTSYFGTHPSEYEQLVVREQDLAASDAPKAPEVRIPTDMTLEQRLCLSFLQCDTELIRDKYNDGSTASVVIVQSKGAFWETKDDLDLILAHVGDTRVLLCEAPRGESIQLTTDHHPDAVVEADRIRKMAAYVSADSFGENMFLGQVANTRALGDIAMKPFGVSAEPELIRRTVKASEAAFLVLITDGITSVMSNQEVVDCVKLENNPTQAAANVLNLAEQLGAEDNCTVLVVKLPAWGAEMPDLSKELREYRWQSEAQQSRARRR